jgi:fructuronate reductase/mannitol 2-dehydrogenase
MANPVLRQFVRGYLQEVSDLLPEVPGIDLEDYSNTLVERFSNPQISDQLSRLCRRSSTKVPSYVLPSVRSALDEDKPRTHLVLAVAAWLRYLRGEDFAGRPIEIEDAKAERLQPLAVQGEGNPRPLLRQYDIFAGLGECPRFTREVEQALQLLEAGPLEAASSLAASMVVLRDGSAA